MKNYDRVKRRLRYLFVLATAVILLLAALIAICIELILTGTGFITAERIESSWLLIIIIFGVVSALIGILISVFVGKFVLSPVNEMLDGMEKLSNGEFETRLDFGDNKSMQVLSDGFNSLAAELEHTEILRTDYINNFSHEIKTPIVSVKGLVGLLKSGRVSPEKQAEYFAIIEDETERLEMMTANILNFSKIENQGILPDKNTFNLSEQIRVSLLLYEKRWSEKQLSLKMDFDEHKICANEDMLKQVWLNLFDNAIKFSYDGGELSVDIQESDGFIRVDVGNTGDEIPESERDKIFNKFYRTSSASSRQGNGIGLALVKSIVTLHGGDVTLSSKEGKTVFSVKLPVF